MKKFILLCLAILFFLPTIFCSKKQTKEKQTETSISISDSYDLTLNDGYRKAVNQYGYRLGTMAWNGEYPILYKDTTIEYSILGFQKKICIETVYLKKILDVEKDQFVIIEEIVPSGKWEISYLTFFSWFIILLGFIIIPKWENSSIGERFNYSMLITTVSLIPLYLIAKDTPFYGISIVINILAIIFGIDLAPVILIVMGFVYIVFFISKFLAVLIAIFLALLGILIYRKISSCSSSEPTVNVE